MSWSRIDILAAIKGENLSRFFDNPEALNYHRLKSNFTQARHSQQMGCAGNIFSDVYETPPHAEYWAEKEAYLKAHPPPECSSSDDGLHHGVWWGKGPESGMYACQHCGATMKPPEEPKEGK